MKELKITDLEAGQRFDKYLDRYLSNATMSFIYKMLRKKNITLNDKKASGSEKLNAGDTVKIFFKDETLDSFTGKAEISGKSEKSNINYKKYVKVIYEDSEILIVDKPKNVLSQKADKNDISMCEYITAYLLDSGALKETQLETFHPGVCNRLDRNTSGLLAAGKTIGGLQALSKAFADRTLEKYYVALVAGEVKTRQKISGFLVKDEKTNKVTISTKELPGSEEILTEYIPVVSSKRLSLVKIHLHTGKTHQIRAHMASCGYPLVGDYKYGNKATNDGYKAKYRIQSQLLHSYQLIIDEKSINVTAPIPKEMVEVLKGEGLWQPGIPEDLEVLR